MTTHDPDQPRRYGETRYRCEADGSRTLIRWTQTYVRVDEESDAFEVLVHQEGARFVLTKQPGESVELLEAWHDGELKRATVIIAPTEDLAARRQRQTLERILRLLRAIAKTIGRNP